MKESESSHRGLTVGLIRPVGFPAIDGIRFYAAMVVFFQHVIGGLVLEYYRIDSKAFNNSSDSGWLRILYYLADGNHGVDVFFIISGFLMARIIFKEGQSFNYLDFIINRVKRIYPAFFVSLVIVTACVISIFGWEWNFPRFVKNLVFLNAFPALQVLPYNHVSWSLGYEFFFYLIIPYIVIIDKIVDRRLLAAVSLIALIILIPNEYIRFSALFVGVLIGSFSDANLHSIARKIPISLMFLLYIFCGLAKSIFNMQFMDFYFPFIFIAATFFVCIVWGSSNIFSRFFSKNICARLGPFLIRYICTTQ